MPANGRWDLTNSKYVAKIFLLEFYIR